MPRFEALGGSVAGISTDSHAEDVQLSNELNINFSLLSDPERRVISAYGVADAGAELARPAVFVISPDGRIKWRALGTSMRDLPPVSTILAEVGRTRPR